MGRVDLEQILCVEHERVVGRDNVVTEDHVVLGSTSSPGAVRVPACGSSSAAISTATIRSGMAPVRFGRHDTRGQPLRAG